MTAGTVGKKLVSCYRVPIGWRLGYVSDEEYQRIYKLREVNEVVAYVKEHTTPQETIWSFSDPIVDLNLLAGRKAPSRFWNPFYIFMAMKPFRFAEGWQKEVIETIHKHPPKIIVMHVIDQQTHRYEYPPQGSPSPLASVFHEALAHDYRLVKNIETYEIYERIP